MTIQDIIIDTIVRNFETIPVYIDTVPQDFKKPAFFVLREGVKYEQKLIGKYSVEYSFKVIYYDEDISKYTQIAVDLTRLLTQINAEDKYYNAHVIEPVLGQDLSFTVSYVDFCTDINEKTAMGEIEHEIK